MAAGLPSPRIWACTVAVELVLDRRLGIRAGPDRV